MTIPPYEPDGSLPPIPVDGVTAKDLLDRYGVSKQTLYTRIKAIEISGTKRGKQVFFSPVEVHQLDAAHDALGKGYGLNDLKDQAGSFDGSDMDVDVASTPVGSTPDPNLHQMELALRPDQTQMATALAAVVLKAVEAGTPTQAQIEASKDPLRPYRMLRESAQEKYQLSSQSVREILGLSQSTINSWGPEVRRNGFLLKRVGPGRWRVFEEEEDMAA